MKTILVCISGLLLAAAIQAALTFTQAPSIQRSAGAWTIAFGVSDTTDVEVTVLKASDTSVVRRLCAGRLGSNPPPPFTARALTQTITWDGRDDIGALVDSNTALRVRVRAGMSVSLDKIGGETPFYFTKILGVAFDQQDGHLYVMGNYNGMGGYNTNVKNVAIRQFDVNGAYTKTCYPCPAGIDTGLLASWPYFKRTKQSYCPLYDTYGIPALMLEGSVMIRGKGVLPYTVNKKVVLVNTDTFTLVDTSSVIQTGKFTTAPIMSLLYSEGPDHQNWFFGSGKALYRQNPATGQRAVWHTFVTGDSVQSVFSVTFDDSGRIYICDRSKGIWVYDTTTWTALGLIPGRLPRQAGVSPSGDEIFVIGGTTSYTLFKFRNWRAPVLVDSLPIIVAPAGALPVFFMKPQAANPTLVVTSVGLGANVQVFRDEGDHFSVLKDFSTVSRDVRLGFAPSVIDRPAVDRKTETVYFTSNFSELYKIADWSACKVVQCSTSSRAPLYAGEATISPDGYLYIREAANNNSYTGPVTKWTTAYYPARSNYGGTSSNVADSEVYGRSGDNFFGEKGIAVSKEGKVADIPIIYGTWADYNLRIIDPANPSASRTNQLTQGVIHPLANHGAYYGSSGLNVPNNVGNVKFDYAGNIYISTSLTPAAHVSPAGYPAAELTQYRNIVVGGVYKFPPNGGSFTRNAPVGALKTYPQALSMFSGGADQWGIGCACRTPRFDLDPWGRLFIPHGLLCEVAVVDNNGNSILTFGGYGNEDSRGAGSRVPSPEIAFINPQAVAASDNYIYVTDPLIPRLTRVRMNFALDNIPIAPVSVESGIVRPDEPLMTCWPNPLNAESRITVALAGNSRVNLGVYAIDGRLIRRIHSGEMGAGRHLLVWNGRDVKGTAAPAGVYFFRLDAGNRHQVMKIVVAR
jgi:hypothetical protein